MKYFLYIFVLVSLLRLSAMAQDSNMIRETLAKTERAIPENYRDSASIVEMRSSLEKVESFTQLQSILKTSWRTNLPQINEFAANDTQKALYFKAAQILPREEYIAFMTAASDQATSGSISKQQFKWALFPSQKNLREMWTEDPPSESLQQLARKAKIILGDDAGQFKFFDHVLSGKVASDNRPPEEPKFEKELTAKGATSAPTATPSTSAKAPPQSSPIAQVEPPRSSPLPWIIGAILLLAVAGGILFKLLRK